MTPKNEHDNLVKVFEATTVSEALVVRGLLKSAGIYAPDFDSTEPFALNDPPEGSRDSEVWVPESQAEDARRIIADATRSSASPPE
jgi:Putative prokaryotic signal transducing protein